MHLFYTIRKSCAAATASGWFPGVNVLCGNSSYMSMFIFFHAMTTADDRRRSPAFQSSDSFGNDVFYFAHTFVNSCLDTIVRWEDNLL